MDLSKLWPLIQPVLAGQLRHVMTVVSGYLIAKGAIQATDSAEFVTMGSGIVLWALTGGWSWYQKYGSSRVLAVMAKMRPVVPQDATMAESVRVATQVADAGPA